MSNRHPTPWRMEVFDNKRRGLYHQHWASVLDGRGEFIVEGLDEATAKEIVENANNDLRDLVGRFADNLKRRHLIGDRDKELLDEAEAVLKGGAK